MAKNDVGSYLEFREHCQSCYFRCDFWHDVPLASPKKNAYLHYFESDTWHFVLLHSEDIVKQCLCVFYFERLLDIV